MVATINPWMLIPTAVILVMFYLIRLIFLASSRDIKRLEAISRSGIVVQTIYITFLIINEQQEVLSTLT